MDQQQPVIEPESNHNQNGMTCERSPLTTANGLYDYSQIHAYQSIDIGDILLFKKSPLKKLAQEAICQMQRLSYMSLGDNDTVHGAICVDKAYDRHPIIAHVTESRQVQASYRKERLSTMLRREGSDRGILIYRPTHNNLSTQLALFANFEEQEGDVFKWCSWRALQVLLTPNSQKWNILKKKNKNKQAEHKARQDLVSVADNIDHPMAELSEKSVCSMFIAEVISQSLDYKTIDSETARLDSHLLTPKGLQHYLNVQSQNAGLFKRLKYEVNINQCINYWRHRLCYIYSGKLLESELYNKIIDVLDETSNPYQLEHLQAELVTLANNDLSKEEQQLVKITLNFANSLIAYQATDEPSKQAPQSTDYWQQWTMRLKALVKKLRLR
jgi:hypothetical protein